MEANDYMQELMEIYVSIPEDQRSNFAEQLRGQQTNPVIAYGLNIWFGFFGADRFYCGQPVLGGLKLVTLGGLGVWVIVDCFLIGGTARDRSIEAARSLAEIYRYGASLRAR